MVHAIEEHRGGVLERMRHLWYLLAVAVPVGLAVLSIAGYHYTALLLERDFRATLLLVFVVILVRSVLVRWLFTIRRRAALQLAAARREARKAAEPQEGGAAAPQSPDPSVAQEEVVSIHDMSRQTRRLLFVASQIVLLLGAWYVWSGALPALRIFRQVELWGTGDELVTMSELIVALIIVAVTVIAGRNAPGFLEIAVLRHLPIDHGARFAIVTIFRYLLAVVGFFTALTVIGFGWGKVQWLVAAMTVGLGFGLQEIFANFVSGIIILFERPMRVGDVVTVGDTTGTVSRIRIRATTIVDWDRKELVVPNKEFITGRLVNWSLSDTILRMVFPVGIAYGSDTDRAESVLLRVAEASSHVLDDPEPMVVFKGFGDSSLDFELRVYIPSIDHYVTAWHEINRAIDREFRKASIEIAFPQRDLHLRTADAPLGIVTQSRVEPAPPEPDGVDPSASSPLPHTVADRRDAKA